MQKEQRSNQFETSNSLYQLQSIQSYNRTGQCQPETSKNVSQNRNQQPNQTEQKNEHKEVNFKKTLVFDKNQQGWNGLQEGRRNNKSIDNTQNVNQKMEILLLIKVEKVVWMEFVGIFHQVSKSYNVSYSYKGRSLRLSGKSQDIQEAQTRILQYQEDHVMEFILKSNVDKYEELIPYVDLNVNQKFLELRQNYPELFVATKKKLMKIHENLKGKHYFCDWISLKDWPISFVAIFCSKVKQIPIIQEIQSIVQTIQLIIQNDITRFQLPSIDQRGFDLTAKKVYSKKTTYEIPKMDYLQLAITKDLLELAVQYQTYIEIRDHNKAQELLSMTIHGINGYDIEQTMNVLLNGCQFGFVEVNSKVVRQEFEIIQKQLESYLTSANDCGNQITIHSDATIYGKANELDQIFGTSILQTITKAHSKLKVDQCVLYILCTKLNMPIVNQHVESFFNVEGINQDLTESSNMSQFYRSIDMTMDQKEVVDLCLLVIEKEIGQFQPVQQQHQIQEEVFRTDLVNNKKLKDCPDLSLIKRTTISFQKLFNILQKSQYSYTITFFNFNKQIQMDKLNLLNFRFNLEDFNKYLTFIYKLPHTITPRYNGRQLSFHIDIETEFHMDYQEILTLLINYMNCEIIIFLQYPEWLNLVNTYKDTLDQLENKLECNILPIMLYLQPNTYQNNLYCLFDKEFQSLRKIVLANLTQYEFNRFAFYISNMGHHQMKSIVEFFQNPNSNIINN